jgi:pentatricopeptide repeat protein
VGGMPAHVQASNAYAHNPLIHALCERGRVADALMVLDGMLCRGCAPDVVNYNILLQAACKGRGYRQALSSSISCAQRGVSPTT